MSRPSVRSSAPGAVATAWTSAHLGGCGPPLVLLHGLYMSWPIWDSVIPMLERHHTVYAPTLAGHHGGPALPSDSVGIGGFADAVERQLDELGWDRVHLVGNSLGGWLAVELAQRGRAMSVVVFSPAGGHTTKWAIRRLALLMTMVGVISRLPGVELVLRFALVRRFLARMMVANPDAVARAKLSEFVRDARVCTGLDGLLAGMDAATPLTFALGDVPIRVAWARTDRTIPWRSYGAPFCASLQSAEQVFLDGVGHVPMYDNPHLVAETILDVSRR